MDGSDVAGRRGGVVVEESVLVAEDAAGLLGRPSREGLTSWKLFFRDRVPGLVVARDACVRESGRVGDGSREASGEGAADEDAEVPEVCEVNLEGQESVLGVIVAVLAVDSRDSVGTGAWAALLVGSVEPFAAPAAGPMFACIRGFATKGRPGGGEELRFVSGNGACQSVACLSWGEDGGGWGPSSSS